MGTSIGDADLMISGQKTISYRYAFAFGKQPRQFFSENFVTPGGTIADQSTFLTLNGTVQNKFYINGTLSDGTYMGSQAQIELKGPNFGLNLGDITANFSGSEFGGFNKNLNGIKLTGNWGRNNLTFITSQIESQTTTETFRGNSYGVYTLRNGFMIIEGSETVWLNGVQQKRNYDYRLDENGQLKFLRAIPHSPSDTITVRYEYGLDFNLNPGTLTGFRAESKINDKISLDTTFLRSTSSKYAQGTTYYNSERFKVGETLSGNPEGPYQLSYWPLVKNADSVVSVEVYKGSTDDSEYTTYYSDRHPQNVKVDWLHGTVTLEGLPLDEGKLLIINYYYYVSFPGDKVSISGCSLESGKIEVDYQNRTNLDLNVDKIRVYLRASSSPSLGLVPPQFLEIRDGKLVIFQDKEGLHNPVLAGWDSGVFTVEIQPVRIFTGSNTESNEDQRVNHTVVALAGQFQATPQIRVQGEVGLTEADKNMDVNFMMNTIPLAGKLFLNPASPADLGPLCLDLASVEEDEEGRKVRLPIEPGSETIALINKTSGKVRLLNAGDYRLDYNTGLLLFGANIEEAQEGGGEGVVYFGDPTLYDQLRLEYRYQTETSLTGIEMVKGTAFKLGVTANYPKLSVATNYRYMDPEFRPLGMSRYLGFGSKEIGRLGTSITWQPLPYLSLSNNYNRYAVLDITAEGKTEELKNVKKATDHSNTLSLNFPRWPSLTLTRRQSQGASGNSNSVDFSSSYTWRIFTFSGGLNQSESEPLSLASQASRSFTRRLGIDVRPNVKVSAGWDYLNGFQTYGSTATRTESHDFTVDLRPNTKLSLTGQYTLRRDLDRTQGSTPYERASISLNATPFPAHTFRASFTRTSDPFGYYGASISDWLSNTWTYQPFTRFSLEATVSASRTRYPGTGGETGTGSTSGTAQTVVRYQPLRWQRQSGTLTWTTRYQPTESISRQTSGADLKRTFTRTFSSSLTLSLRPMARVSLSGSYEYQLSPSTYGSSELLRSNTLNLSTNYTLNSKIQGTGSLSWTDRARSSWYANTTVGQRLESTVGIAYSMSPTTQINLDYKLVGMMPKDPNQGYFGNIITTKLVGSF